MTMTVLDQAPVAGDGDQSRGAGLLTDRTVTRPAEPTARQQTRRSGHTRTASGVGRLVTGLPGL